MYIVRDIQSALKGKLCLRPCSDPVLPEFLPDCGIAALRHCRTLSGNAALELAQGVPRVQRKEKKMPYVMYMYICF